MKNKERKYFIPVNETLKEVNEEIYRAYYRPIWNTRYYARKNGECRCTKANLWKCDGDCIGCRYHTAGRTVSLETPIGSEADELNLGDTLTDDVPSMESILMDTELLDALYEELEHLDPESKRICQLFMEGFSERESAKIMGMARSTFKRHWEKIRTYLQEKLRDYFL